MSRQLSLSPTRKPVRAPKVTETTEPQNVTPEVKELDLGFEIDPKKTYIFEVLEKSPNPRFQNLGSNTLALDPDQKRYIELVYHPTAKSIFKEDLDDSYDEIQSPPLGFWYNQITCIGEDIRKMEYLLNHPLYEHSPFRVYNKPALYTMADKDVQEAIKAKRLDTELRALKLIQDTEIDELRPVARTIYGITDESELAIRNGLSDIAKRPKKIHDSKSPAETIIASIDDQYMRRSFHIQEAVDKGVIAVDVNTMRVSYVQGDVHIWHLVYKKDPIKQLTDWSFTPEGQRFWAGFKARNNK